MPRTSRPTWVTQEGFVYDGAFRTNVEAFVGHFGELVPLQKPSVTCWIVEVNVGGSSPSETTLLYVYEELASDSQPVVCDHCRIIGWQQHPVCNKRYHFIIPSSSGAAPLVPSKEEALRLQAAQNHDPEAEGSDSPYVAPTSDFDSQGHLLHGILHLNGYGHLLRINGLEGGSDRLTGRQIMDTWDRLCTLLRARKISVEDVSNKAGMELRVLYAAAQRSTWYGRWDYGFGRGPFNISKKTWKAALHGVNTLPIADVEADFFAHTGDRVLPKIIQQYQVEVPGESAPATLGEFLAKMLFLLGDAEAAKTVLCSGGASHKVVKAVVTDLSEPARKHKGKKRNRDEMLQPETNDMPLTGKVTEVEPEGVQPAQQGKEDETSRLGWGLQAAPQAVLETLAEENGQPGVVVKSKRSRTKGAAAQKKGSKKRLSQRGVADTLPIRHSSLKPLDYSSGPARYEKDALKSGVDAVVAFLKANQGSWVRRTALKAAVTKHLKDSHLVDACLKLLGNVTIDDLAVFRQMDKVSNLLFFLLEPSKLEDRLHPVVHDLTLREPLKDVLDEAHVADADFRTPSSESGGQGRRQAHTASRTPEGMHPEHDDDAGNASCDAMGEGRPVTHREEGVNAAMQHADVLQQRHCSAEPRKIFDNGTTYPSPAADDVTLKEQDDSLRREPASASEGRRGGCTVEVEDATSVDEVVSSVLESLVTTIEQCECKAENSLAIQQIVEPPGTLQQPLNQRNQSGSSMRLSQIGPGESACSDASLEGGQASAERAGDLAAPDSPEGTDAEHGFFKDSRGVEQLVDADPLAEPKSAPLARPTPGSTGRARARDSKTAASKPGMKGLQGLREDQAQLPPGRSQSTSYSDGSEAMFGSPVRGKRTHKGKPAPSLPTMPADRVRSNETAERPLPHSGSSDKLAIAAQHQPAGAWGTRGQRSARPAGHASSPLPASPWHPASARLQQEAAPLLGTKPAVANAPEKSLPAGRSEVVKLEATDAASPMAALEQGQELSAEAGRRQSSSNSVDPQAGAPTSSALQAKVDDPAARTPLPTPSAEERVLENGAEQGKQPRAATPGVGRVAAALLARKSGSSLGKRTRLKRSSSSSNKRARQAVSRRDTALTESKLGGPTRKPWQLLDPGGPFKYQQGCQPRDQVLCDLVYFFECVLQCYHPAVAADLVPPALMPEPGSVSVKPPGKAVGTGKHVASSRKRSPVLKAAKLVELVAVLRDTKHFLKDYGGNDQAPGEGLAAGQSVRLLCQLEPMDFVSAETSMGTAGPGRRAPSAKARGKSTKKRRIVHPPAELLLLTPKTTVKQLHTAAQEAFRHVYVMFSNLKVHTVHGLPAKALTSRIGRVADNTLLKLVGEGADPSPRWHHAGGEEDWVVSCRCGCRDDDGERMIACDCCGLWMHLRCQDIPDAAAIPEHFVCPRCSDKAQA